MLTKLIIKAYAAGDLNEFLGEWSAQINPEGYREAYRAVFVEDRGIDTAGSVIRYRTQKPQDLALKFFLDGTGVIPDADDVAERIKKFRDLVYSYNGKHHSPNVLEVIWGKLVFRSVLASLDIDYSLFAPDGSPLRAELNAVFREHKTPEEVARKASKRSADLTHSRIMNAGETLPLVSHEIYRDPGFHVDVARANDLDTLTLLEPGDRVTFPRMED